MLVMEGKGSHLSRKVLASNGGRFLDVGQKQMTAQCSTYPWIALMRHLELILARYSLFIRMSQRWRRLRVLVFCPIR